MTVSYGDRSFLLLLFRWKGSVWKDVYKAYIVFISFYFILNISYRYGMDEKMQKKFEKTVNYFDEWNKIIPLEFLIGFFVTVVFDRWWQQLNYVGFPDKFLACVAGNIQAMDPESVAIRKTFARYANLLNVLVWKEISVKIKKRFPTDEHLLHAGLMSVEEMELFKGTSDIYGRWFVPVPWMNNLLARCKEEGRISDHAHQKLIYELDTFRNCSAMLTTFDWIDIPLLYTQVVTLATYGSLVVRDYSEDVDIVFPLFTTFEFIFYLGWMKVGETLRCPFGEDDDDFDMNFVLDRNIHVSLMLVDELHKQRPSASHGDDSLQLLSMRLEWEGTGPLPHTQASWKVRDTIPNWRLHKYRVSEALSQLYQEAGRASAVVEQKMAQIAELEMEEARRPDAAEFQEIPLKP